MVRVHPAGVQQMAIINESGLYALTFRSRHPAARQFLLKVTREVLPKIRKTGSYSAVPAPTHPAIPQTFADALQFAADQARQIERQAAEIEAAEVMVAEMAPRAEAWDDLASGDGDYLVGDAAKMLCRVDGISTGQNRLYRFMAEKRWIYRANGKTGPWRAMQSAVDAGWLAERVSMGFHVRDDEVVANAPQVRVTVRGLERLRKMMTGGGDGLRAIEG